MIGLGVLSFFSMKKKPEQTVEEEGWIKPAAKESRMYFPFPFFQAWRADIAGWMAEPPLVSGQWQSHMVSEVEGTEL